MTVGPGDVVLCVNAGSSSMKCAVYRVDGPGVRLGDARADGSGPEALDEALGRLGSAVDEATAVGHRVVHGGPDHVRPTVVDDRLVADLTAVVPLAPLHVPPALAAIDVLRRRCPDRPQVACFDTAFHQTLPEVAWRLPLPASVTGRELRRYGFHGLSCEYVVGAIGAARLGRSVVAHLGSGVSLTAVRDGRSVDTTMGLTPAGGVVMATRSGDVDPGVLLYLARHRGFDVDRLEQLVDREAGLRGLTGTSGDMREVLARGDDGDPEAALAVDVFVTRVQMQLGAYAVLLDGLDSLVFTGGIGAASATIRSRICAGLAQLRVTLDEERNAAHAPVVSRAGAPVTVHVVTTDEELVIARHTRAVLTAGGAPT